MKNAFKIYKTIFIKRLYDKNKRKRKNFNINYTNSKEKNEEKELLDKTYNNKSNLESIFGYFK